MSKPKMIFLLLLIIGIIPVLGNTCKSSATVTNKDCFTDIIKFDQNVYRAGHAVVTQDNELLIEYSLDADSSTRLFYGLQSNGRNYFPDDSFVKTINVDSHENVKCRYESMNRLVRINSDTLKNKEYILSVSTYRAALELHDLSDFSNTVINSIRYFGHQIFSFEFPLLEAKDGDNYIYFCIFSHDLNYESNGLLYGQEKGFHTSISKFSFSSFAFDTSKVSTKEVEGIKYSDRVITGFIIDELKYVAVIFVKNYDNKNKFLIRYYDFDLNSNYNDYIKLFDFGLDNLVEGHGIYYKAIYLSNYYLAFAYFSNKNNAYSFNIKILQLYRNSNLADFGTILEKALSDYELSTDITLNEFIKYDDERLVFISNKNTEYFCILLFYFSDTYTKMKVRYYSFALNTYKLSKEMSAYFWKDYLLYLPSYNDGSTHSFLMIFGFANGTDFTMDISPHLMDTGSYVSGNDLVTRLLKNLTIDNNIFGYKSTGQIKLTYIPPELLFYDSDENQLTADCIIDSTHILKQNVDIEKSDKLYKLEYQYIIKDSEADIDLMAHSTYNHNKYTNKFSDKIYYGRTNILQFKLCHAIYIVKNALNTVWHIINNYAYLAYQIIHMIT